MKRSAGFTLLEMIGVIAIMAIMAAVMAPSLVRSVDDAYGDAETENLAAIAQGLEDAVRRRKSIPGPNPADWAAAIAAETDLPADKIRDNPRGFRRAIYFDPRFFTAANSAFAGYTQTVGLSAPPVLPRAIVVSMLRANAPNAPTTGAQFDLIWNQDPAAAVVEDTYTRIARLNFSPYFHRVLLTNQHTQQPAYELEGGTRTALPAASGGADGTLTRYVLRGTELRLFQAPTPGGGFETAQLANADTHWRYTSDGTSWFWSRQ
jgi:prepilin-type N-terminal cleavage/methylation domain-containing protein